MQRRYKREVPLGQRGAVRKLLDGDANPRRAMVLCVAALRGAKDGGPPSALTLTDGWWPIDAQLDRQLASFAQSGRIRVGDKLLLVGAVEGVAGSAAGDSAVTLRVHVNGTRKAQRSARLGWCVLTHLLRTVCAGASPPPCSLRARVMSCHDVCRCVGWGAQGEGACGFDALQVPSALAVGRRRRRALRGGGGAAAIPRAIRREAVGRRRRCVASPGA